MLSLAIFILLTSPYSVYSPKHFLSSLWENPFHSRSKASHLFWSPATSHLLTSPTTSCPRHFEPFGSLISHAVLTPMPFAHTNPWPLSWMRSLWTTTYWTAGSTQSNKPTYPPTAHASLSPSNLLWFYFQSLPTLTIALTFPSLLVRIWHIILWLHKLYQIVFIGLFTWWVSLHVELFDGESISPSLLCLSASTWLVHKMLVETVTGIFITSP